MENVKRHGAVVVTAEGPIEAWGLILSFISMHDLTPLNEQIGDHYIGGWRDFEGFEVEQGSYEEHFVLAYPHDPPLNERARVVRESVDGTVKDMIVLFPYSWVLYTSDGGKTHRIARID